MDCAICRSDMGIESYEVNTQNEDIPVNETVLRLKCGHAYHCMCIVMALRSSPKCPLCRDVPVSNTLLPDFGEVVELAHPMELHIDLGDVLRVEETLDIIDTVRSSVPKIQRARCQFNIERSKLIVYGQELERKRKAKLQETVAEFRKEHRNTWEKRKRDVQKKLTKIKMLEKAAIEEKHTSEIADQAVEDMHEMYELHNHIGVNAMRKSFWTK